MDVPDTSHIVESSFALALESYSERPAIVSAAGEIITYAALAVRADNFAASMPQRQGLLVVEMRNEIEPVIAYLAALRARRPVLLLNEGALARDDRIARAFHPGFIYRNNHGEWILEEKQYGGGCAGAMPEFHPDLALLLSTSGSTGTTKLVRLSHLNLNSNAQSIAKYLAIDPDRRAVTSLPLHYAYGLSVVNSHLMSGASLLLTSDSVTNPRFWSLVDEHAVTDIAGVPYTYELLDSIGFQQRTTPSLRVMTQAGGRLSPDRVLSYAQWGQANGVDFFVMYGQTEATARMAYMRPDQVASFPDHIGQPVPGGRLRVVDDDGNDLPCNVPGELVYTGPNVMMGYATSPEDLALGCQVETLRTGDMACRNSNGLYRIVGRKSRISKPFGLRIALDELETFLLNDGISAAVAGDDAGIAVCISDTTPLIGLIRRISQHSGLPVHAIRAYHADELPRLSSGKMDYALILRHARSLVDAESPAGADAQNLIAEAMSRILGFPVRPEDSFASLGGDSLSYVQMTVHLESLLSPAPAGWETMTVSELAKLHENRNAGASRGWMVGIDSEILLRACAILAVVTTHVDPGNPPLPGGALALFMLAGYSLARFNGQRLMQGNIWPVLRAFMLQILLPYYLLYAVMIMSADAAHPTLAGLLLYANFESILIGPMAPYWFIHALWQCLLVTCAAFALPSLRKRAVEHPWSMSLALLMCALLIKMVAALIWRHDIVDYRTPDAILYILVLGWLIHQSRNFGERLALLGSTMLLTAIDFGAASPHNLWLTAATAILLFMPRIAIPRPLYVVIAAVGGASFWIYLTHMFAIQIVHYEMGIPGYILPLIAACGLGIMTHQFQLRVRRGEFWRLVRGPESRQTRVETHS